MRTFTQLCIYAALLITASCDNEVKSTNRPTLTASVEQLSLSGHIDTEDRSHDAAGNQMLVRHWSYSGGRTVILTAVGDERRPNEVSLSVTVPSVEKAELRESLAVFGEFCMQATGNGTSKDWAEWIVESVDVAMNKGQLVTRATPTSIVKCEFVGSVPPCLLLTVTAK